MSTLLRMASVSGAGADDEAPPPAPAPADEFADAQALAEPAKPVAAPRAPLCTGRASGPSFFGPVTAEAVTGQVLLTALVVVVLSIAGDAHGSATKARAGRAPGAQALLLRPPFSRP